MPKPRTSRQGETKGIRQKDNSPKEFSGGTHRRLRLGFRSIDVQDASASRTPEIVCRKLTSVGISKTISASVIDILARINGHPLIVEIDSGCDITGINLYLVYKLGLATRNIDTIKITNADGSKNASNITDKEASFTLELPYHASHTRALVYNIGKSDILLGKDWLKIHNPEINWKTGQYEFTRCPSQCKITTIARIRKTEAEKLPNYLIPYQDQFKEKDIEKLPDHRPWDVQINLIPNPPRQILVWNYRL